LKETTVSSMDINKRTLFISYNGAMEPVLKSQGIPYLHGLYKKDFEITLLTYEKKGDLKKKEEIKKMNDTLRDAGIKWYYLTYHKNPSFIATAFDLFVGLIYSSFLVLKEGIKIVHARGATPSVIAYALKKLFRIKFIFDMRGFLADEYASGEIWKKNDFKYKLVKWFERLFLKSADHIVVLTEAHYHINRNLPYLSGDNKSMTVIPCCVDLDRFKPLPHNLSDKFTPLESPAIYGGDDIDPLRKSVSNGVNKVLIPCRKGGVKAPSFLRGFTFLYLGAISPWYMVEEMLDFFLTAKTKIPNAHFVFLTQSDFNPIKKILNKKNIEPEFITFVRLPHEEVHKFIPLVKAGIFFDKPFKRLGSSPIKFGEFLACGIPVIINYGMGDTEKIVKENRVGVVVDEFSEERYIKAVNDLKDLMRENDLKNRCRKTAKQYLSLDSGIEKYFDIYNSLVGK
ncbi:MAG: glycosyltransferase, partial [Nitrospirota bacterium]